MNKSAVANVITIGALALSGCRGDNKTTPTVTEPPKPTIALTLPPTEEVPYTSTPTLMATTTPTVEPTENPKERNICYINKELFDQLSMDTDIAFLSSYAMHSTIIRGSNSSSIYIPGCSNQIGFEQYFDHRNSEEQWFRRYLSDTPTAVFEGGTKQLISVDSNGFTFNWWNENNYELSGLSLDQGMTFKTGEQESILIFTVVKDGVNFTEIKFVRPNSEGYLDLGNFIKDISLSYPPDFFINDDKVSVTLSTIKDYFGEDTDLVSVLNGEAELEGVTVIAMP